LQNFAFKYISVASKASKPGLGVLHCDRALA
jgi:hypothetical protein